ncbi:MAG: hypothetical protein ACO3PV_03970 [Pseudohongiellaceae bacterium]
MRSLAYYWGITGVILLLASAIVRLTPRMLELRDIPLSGLQWLLLVLFVVFMLYSEGWKGFHLNFAPRVVARAAGLRSAPRPLLVLLAPLVCMGYLHATRKRQFISLLLTSSIIALVLLVRLLPQPWRGIIDTGVVLGLVSGTLSIVWHWLRQDLQGVAPGIAADLPQGD